MKEDQVYFQIMITPLGFLGIAANRSQVLRVIPPYESESIIQEKLKVEFPEGKFHRLPWPEIIRDLDKYFAGKPIKFDYPVRLTGMTPFYRKILKVVAGIPFGKVKTYGEIARRAGKAGAQRSVGQALAKNPVPLLIPCHRVIGSDRSLTGFSALGGTELKRQLLILEGHAFSGKEKLKLK